MTPEDINNLLFFLKRVPTNNLQEAAVLVALAQKLTAALQGAARAEDVPPAA